MLQHEIMCLWPFSLSLYLSEQEECLEKVIKDTECLFKSREKEYQETIDQIEVRGLHFTLHSCFIHPVDCNTIFKQDNVQSADHYHKIVPSEVL